MTNDQVIKCWLRSEAVYRYPEASLWTTGLTLMSYDLIIGDTLPDGTKVTLTDVVIPSVTTRKHYNMAKRILAKVV